MKVLSDNELRDALGLSFLVTLSCIGLLLTGFMFRSWPQTSLCLMCLYFFLIGQSLIAAVHVGKHYTIKYLRGNR